MSLRAKQREGPVKVPLQERNQGEWIGCRARNVRQPQLSGPRVHFLENAFVDRLQVGLVEIPADGIQLQLVKRHCGKSALVFVQSALFGNSLQIAKDPAGTFNMRIAFAWLLVHLAYG